MAGHTTSRSIEAALRLDSGSVRLRLLMVLLPLKLALLEYLHLNNS